MVMKPIATRHQNVQSKKEWEDWNQANSFSTLTPWAVTELLQATSSLTQSEPWSPQQQVFKMMLEDNC